MKSLALYIDKWYIVGAVNTDGITRLVNLPNHEDRIWLYFYEDVANDEISYGKGFQSKYRNNENHYYGDVFNSITSLSANYTMFKRPQPMKGIFKSSKIFDDLRKDIEVEGDIETYVSFSKDVSLAARLIFLNELRSDGFDVKESVARIDHLALEYAAKKNNFAEDGYYLVLNACNENLHYSLYQKSEDIFVRESEENLTGLGTDVRSRALIEYVVDNINDRERFLKTKEEREAEYLRMTQYVDEWLIKLNACKSFIPVQITNVTFSRDPYKSYSVSVRKPKIDERTEKIVTDIVNVIKRFVSDSKVSHEQIKGVMLLGNTFGNSQFRAELRSHYNLPADMMVGYMDRDLSTLVSSYLFIDCEQFSTLSTNLRANAEAELKRLQNAEREAEENLKELEKAEKKQEEERLASEAERKYKEAMEHGYDAEREHNYDDMEEYFHIALGLLPDNEEAKHKHEEALRKKAELAVQQNNYKEKIQQAKAAYDENDYETAKFKAEEALGYMPESKEALRIKEDAHRRIKSQKDLERYLDRADLFIAQRAYNEASLELQKARLLDVDEKEIIEREVKIAKDQHAFDTKVRELTNTLNSAISEERYEDALKCCNELIEVDFANSRRWSVKLADINTLKTAAAERQKIWEKLLRKIDSALLAEEWLNLAELCKKALGIHEDADIRTKLKKAEDKLADIKKNELFSKTMSEINELAVRKEFDEANSKLNSLERSLKQDGLLDSSKEKLIRDTRKSLFDFGQSSSASADRPREPERNNNRTRVTGFSNEPKKPQRPKRPVVDSDFDWDFGTPQKPKKPIQKSLNPKQQNPKSNDSFFDSATTKQPKIKSGGSKPIGLITNDDFNF